MTDISHLVPRAVSAKWRKTTYEAILAQEPLSIDIEYARMLASHPLRDHLVPLFSQLNWQSPEANEAFLNHNATLQLGDLFASALSIKTDVQTQLLSYDFELDFPDLSTSLPKAKKDKILVMRPGLHTWEQNGASTGLRRSQDELPQYWKVDDLV